MLLFLDGGIINGTPNDVSPVNQIKFMSKVDQSFVVLGLLIIAVHLAYYSYYIISRAILLYKRRTNLKDNELKMLEK